MDSFNWPPNLNMKKLRALLINFEGVKDFKKSNYLRIHLDDKEKETIAFGNKFDEGYMKKILDKHDIDIESVKSGEPIPKFVAFELMGEALRGSVTDLRKRYVNFDSFKPAYQETLTSVVYRLGMPKYLAQFKKMNKAVADGDFLRAAFELEPFQRTQSRSSGIPI